MASLSLRSVRAGRLLVLFSACLTLVASGLAREPEAEVKKLSFNHTTLQNGLEIYSIEDHSSPTVAVQVWYHAGSKDDPDGRSGFAHLSEHRMFNGNEHRTHDTSEQLTEHDARANNA